MDFLKIDMRDTDTNYGVDIRDAAVIVSTTALKRNL
jgi:hypothetical protein